MNKTKLEKIVEAQLKDAGFNRAVSLNETWESWMKCGELTVCFDIQSGFVFENKRLYMTAEIWAGSTDDLLLGKKEFELTENEASSGAWIKETLCPLFKEAWKILEKKAEAAAQAALTGDI